MSIEIKPLGDKGWRIVIDNDPVLTWYKDMTAEHLEIIAESGEHRVEVKAEQVRRLQAEIARLRLASKVARQVAAAIREGKPITVEVIEESL